MSKVVEREQLCEATRRLGGMFGHIVDFYWNADPSWGPKKVLFHTYDLIKIYFEAGVMNLLHIERIMKIGLGIETG